MSGDREGNGKKSNSRDFVHFSEYKTTYKLKKPCNRRYNVDLPLSEHFRTDSGRASRHDTADGISSKFLGVTHKLKKGKVTPLQAQLWPRGG